MQVWFQISLWPHCIKKKSIVYAMWKKKKTTNSLRTHNCKETLAKQFSLTLEKNKLNRNRKIITEWSSKLPPPPQKHTLPRVTPTNFDIWDANTEYPGLFQNWPF